MRDCESNRFEISREYLKNGNFREVSVKDLTFVYRGTPLPDALLSENIPDIEVFEAYRLIEKSPRGFIVQKVRNNEMKGCLTDIIRKEIIAASIALRISEEPCIRYIKRMRRKFGSDLNSDGLDLIGFPDEQYDV